MACEIGIISALEHPAHCLQRINVGDITSGNE